MEYWKKVDLTNKTLTVESHSYSHKVPNAIQITKQEYDEFIATLPKPVVKPSRDLFAEINEIKAKIADYEDLKARIGKLEQKVDELNKDTK